jgi:N-acetylglucosaminyl-diphospho-decaprenol L-rhamnosyltransferase
MSRPSGVSVVVPHYGDPALAESLVDSLLRQDMDRPLEVIVVDDASPTPFPRQSGLVVCRRETNGGFGAAVNTGVELASHELVIALNSDLEIETGFIEQLARASEPFQPAVVAPRVLAPDGKPVYNARRFPTTRQFVTEWMRPLAPFRATDALRRAVGYDLRSRSDTTFHTDWVVGAALLFRRTDFLAVGGFDPRYHMNNEEVDLQLRLRRAGVPAIFVGAVTCRHAAGSSSGDFDERRARLVRARLLYVAKWQGSLARRRLQVLLTLVSLANAAWLAVRRLTGAKAHPITETRNELRAVWPRPADHPQPSRPSPRRANVEKR